MSYVGYTSSEIASNKYFNLARAVMIKQDAIKGIHAASLAIVDRDPVLSSMMILLQGETGFRIDLNALHPRATSLVNAVIPTSGVMCFVLQHVLFALSFLQSGDDVFEVLGAGFIGRQESIGRFYVYQFFSPPMLTSRPMACSEVLRSSAV